MHRTATRKQAQMSIAIRTGSGPIIHRLLHHYTETHGTFIRPIIMYIFSIIALIKTQAYIGNLFNSSLIKARQLIGSNGSSRRCPWDEDGSRPSPSHGDLSSTVLYSTVISLKGIEERDQFFGMKFFVQVITVWFYWVLANGSPTVNSQSFVRN